jgi:hypothetical protein
METKPSLRFWRVVLWGVITFLLFFISFRHFFGASIAVQVEKKEAILSVPPNPFVPSIVSAVLALLLVMLGMVAVWWLQSRLKPVPLRHRFVIHKGNTELSVRLVLLVVLLAVCSSFPTSSRFNTCRSCLWTANQALHFRAREPWPDFPAEGFYHFSDGDGVHAGMYAKGGKGLDRFRGNKFDFEDVQANRTRFGWPFRTITLDVVPRESEWHLVFETDVFGCNLFLLFLGWLCIHPIFSIWKWVFRFNKSVEKIGHAADTRDEIVGNKPHACLTLRACPVMRLLRKNGAQRSLICEAALSFSS